MLLKVIDKDKVKVLIEDKDLEEYSVTFENLDSNDASSREFLLMLLNEIYSNTGLNFLQSKVLVEAIPGISNSYYIIITRLSPSSDNTVNIDKTAKADEDMYLFELYSPENIFDIAGVFEKNKDIKISATRMYKYRGKYYFTVDFPPETVSGERFYIIIKSITEFCVKCKWSLINEALLEEWGELIAQNPIQSIRALLK